MIAGNPVDVRPLGGEDRAAALALHNRVFGATVTPAWHDWKYGAGNGRAVGVWEEGASLVAHFGGVPRNLLWYGERQPWIQIGDVMVVPELRGLMTRRGPFHIACEQFFSSQVGTGHPHRGAFGFPNQRHLRLGLALGLYHDAGEILQLTVPCGTAPVQAGGDDGWVLQPLSADALLGKEVAQAWEAMARDWRNGIVGERTGAYLCWRYLERPDVLHYHCYGLFRRSIFPWRRTLSGVIVLKLRPLDKEAGGDAEWLDWVGPLDNLPVALRLALHEAKSFGADKLHAWISRGVAERYAQDLRALGASFSASGASLAIARCSLLPSPDVAGLDWWWLGGDTDFL